MDAVIIGASNVIAFWQPLFGWADHGIAVWSISIPGLTCAAFKNMIIEARKTQPDALYIVSLSTFKGGNLALDVPHLHHALDYMPFSLNKLRMTHDMVKRSQFTGLDSLEFYFPIIRFHNRWNDLKSWAFGSSNISLKMSYRASSFNRKVYDISDSLVLDNDTRKSMPTDVGEVFNELLDYFDANHVNALFVKSPQVANLQQQARMNTMEDMLAERGYPCLDLLEDFYNAGFDTKTDFYNKGHTNIHGSLKFSKALGDYLVENYHFENKRGLPGWEDWDEAFEKYNASCSEYTLPFEREHAPRYVCEIPALGKLTVKERTIKLTWKGVEEADGYVIFRKSKENGKVKPWNYLAEVDANLYEYTDNDLKASTEYTYTVVPIQDRNEIRKYGSFDVLGMSVMTGGEKK